jgi:hypothetical protein
MVASHKGLESLGRVLTLGVTTCTVTSLVLLPALLTWLRPAADGDDCAADEQLAVSDDVAEQLISDREARLAA